MSKKGVSLRIKLREVKFKMETGHLWNYLTTYSLLVTISDRIYMDFKLIWNQQRSQA